MGYYIETDCSVGKASRLLELYPDRIVRWEEVTTFADIPEGKTAVCVASNPGFDAAGVIYDAQEFEAFREPGDYRSKTWLLVDTDLARDLCPGFPPASV